MNIFAPLKTLKFKRKHSPLPWFDLYLVKARRRCDKLHKISLANPLNQAASLLHKNARQSYQSLLRLKKIEYFKNKTNDKFKNSKLFWSFYQSSIKLKSDKSGNEGPDTIIYNGVQLSDKKQIVHAFNNHFSSFESNSDTSYSECQRFIFDSFKTQNLRLPDFEFEFKPVCLDILKRFISELDSTSSSGCSEISIKLVKSESKQLTYIIFDQ